MEGIVLLVKTRPDDGESNRGWLQAGRQGNEFSSRIKRSAGAGISRNNRELDK